MNNLKLDPRAINLTGQRFSRLTVVSPEGKDSGGIRWLCKCDCGNTAVIRGSSLRAGVTKSCGCYNKDSHTKHGYDGTRTYKTWSSMKERCDNPKHHASKRYSDRGISYCDKWSSFEGFLSDMGDRPKGRSLDRKDNNKGYSLENCRWATPREQALNRATNVVIKYKGQSRILRDWAREFSMNPNTFYTRYKNGWTMSEIENTPILKRADNDSCKKNNSKSKRR